VTATRTLRVATWLLVGGIAALAFLVSFEAIAAYAVQVGAFPRGLRWAAPLLVDTFTVAATLVILARSRDGVRAGYAWSLVVVASTVSVALNIAHAPPHLAARAVASLPPAALLASLELVMSEARRRRTAPVSPETATVPSDAGLETVQAQQETPGAQQETVQAQQGTAAVPPEGTAGDGLAPRERLRGHLAAHPGVTLTAGDAARLLGVSRSHAGRLLASERAAGNGHGA
jgi:hypothetical protein